MTLMFFFVINFLTHSLTHYFDSSDNMMTVTNNSISI